MNHQRSKPSMSVSSGPYGMNTPGQKYPTRYRRVSPAILNVKIGFLTSITFSGSRGPEKPLTSSVRIRYEQYFVSCLAGVTLDFDCFERMHLSAKTQRAAL